MERIEVITSVQRRRLYNANEKAHFVVPSLLHSPPSHKSFGNTR
jgi:hypothetical protein